MLLKPSRLKKHESQTLFRVDLIWDEDGDWLVNIWQMILIKRESNQNIYNVNIIKQTILVEIKSVFG